MSEHIFFVGIAGIGVSALAQVAQARGAKVSGSDPYADPQSHPAIARLLAGGAKIYREHRPSNLAPDVSLVVATAAVSSDNPEVQEAQYQGIRVVSRAEYLGELMAAHQGPKIAVAGTHGKTTTTAMIGVMLQHAGLDPTVFVGGEVPQLGGNVRIGSETGPFVAEACEAYDSFLYLKPDIAVITNIEADHLDHYGTMENVLKAFLRFANNTKETLILGRDSHGILDALEYGREGGKQLLGYSIREFPAASRASDIAFQDQRARFNWFYDETQRKWSYEETEKTPVVLHVPGKHNVLNALAAATVGKALGMQNEGIASGLAEFRGAERRQEILAEIAFQEGSVLVMDDYAHHPTEIRATLEALRSAYPERRLVTVFQPHLYSRTRDFLKDFAEALSLTDALIVTDIYAAREKPLQGVWAADIVYLVAQSHSDMPALYLPDKQDIPARLQEFAHPGDLIVFMGAGDIREQGEAFVRQSPCVENTRA